jgi:hypothetical protein
MQAAMNRETCQLGCQSSALSLCPLAGMIKVAVYLSEQIVAERRWERLPGGKRQNVG